MRKFGYITPVITLVFLTVSAIYADPNDDSDDCGSGCFSDSYSQELNEKDWDALYDYINTKRTINVQEKECNLTISGDVRVDWRNTCEKRRGQQARGGKARDRLIITDGSDEPLGYNQWIDYEHGLPIGKNKFDIEFNLILDYVADRAWAVSHLQFDNCAGVSNQHSCEYDKQGMHGSGTGCDINLKKAYFGYNILCDGSTRFDIEIGRRRLYQVFDSEIQFLSRFDGVLLKYDSSTKNVGDWYFHLGGFIIDSRVNHFGYVGETGLREIMNSGFDLKYSFINWRKYGKNRCFVENPDGTKFMVSQVTLYYNLDPQKFYCMPAQFFAAFAYNHDAVSNGGVNYEDVPNTFKDKANMGWYAGFQVGEVVKACDWAFSVQYQWVEAKVIPDDDSSGIGRGNVFRESFTAVGRGNTNFKGWRLELLYALTNNISMDARLEWSHEISKRYGGNQDFSQFKLEAIYAY